MKDLLLISLLVVSSFCDEPEIERGKDKNNVPPQIYQISVSITLGVTFPLSHPEPEIERGKDNGALKTSTKGY